MKGSGRPTIRSVAERAGVSRAAVSKVLRNQYGVSAALRARVEDAVRELNYRPLASARALRGRGHAIGVLMAEIANPFFPQIIDGVAQALDGTDYQTFLGIGHFQEVRQERMVEMMIDRQMDGLIVIAPSMSVDTLQKFVSEIPVVVVGYSRPDATGFDTINNEDHFGAGLVVRHFYELGHRNIALLTTDGPQREENVAEVRAAGYAGAMRELGIEGRIRICRAARYSPAVPPAVLELLAKESRPTAVFAVSDGYAVHLYNAADKLGIAIPSDLAIAGYDDSWMCSVAPLSLTSVRQSGTMLGTKAVQLLMERIAGRTQAVHLQLPPKLIVRSSSGGRVRVRNDRTQRAAPRQ
jgi:LacI family transcriptional regulator